MLQIGEILLCKYNPNSVFVLRNLPGKKKRRLSSQVKCFLSNAEIGWYELFQMCGRRIPVAMAASGYLHPVCTCPCVTFYIFGASLSTRSSCSLRKRCCTVHHSFCRSALTAFESQTGHVLWGAAQELLASVLFYPCRVNVSNLSI